MGWSGVRDAHGEILRLIEQGRLKWTNIPARTKAIGKALRRVHLAAQAKINSKSKGSPRSQASKQKEPQVAKRTCPEYQLGDCSFAANHTTDGVQWLHCCATCYRVRRQRYTHTKAECNRQKSMEGKGTPKNS